MKPTFDLLQSPWVPCIQSDGTPIELGLRDVLAQAHQLRELHSESPLVTAALYRLLLAVLHRVFGPANPNEWAALWTAGRWDVARLEAYLDRWHHRFDLFDPEHPFYQAPDERVKPKSVVSLIHDVASGNNPTLFDHHTEAEGITLAPAQAARMLVAAQAFGLGGLSGLPQKFTDAPCAGGVIFLVQGETLFETLALNLVRYVDDAPLPRWPDDRPAWEMDDPFTPDRSLPRGYLDYLTWQNRRILLLPEATTDDIVVRQVTIAPALRLESNVLDPMKHYRKDKKRGPLPLLFTEGRALWRDSAVLFRLHDEGYQPPQAFRWLAALVGEDCLSKSQTRRYLALGMSKKQAKVNFYRSERMPLSLDYLVRKELVEALETALAMAESTAHQLWGATRTLATLILSPEADVESARQPAREDLDSLTHQWAVERRYWSRLEIPFRETMEALPAGAEEALERWRATILRTAWRAFGQVTDNLGYDPHTLKAVVRARDQLAAGLGKALSTSGSS
jgi:CRISPR system Cascade subunit CasA